MTSEHRADGTTGTRFSLQSPLWIRAGARTSATPVPPPAPGPERAPGMREYIPTVFPSLLQRPVRAALVVLLLAAVVAGIWLWQRAGESTPVSEESALRDFRAEGGGAAAPGIPAPGVYTYRQEGTERGGVGPAHISRDLPGEARFVVTTADGGYRAQLSMSEEHVEGVTVRVGAAGSREVARRTKVTFLGFGRDDRRALRPPPLWLPATLAAGRTWGGSYTAGDLPVTYRSRVLRRDAVEVDGRRWAVWVVRSESSTGGVHPGDRTDTWWWSPRLALALRWEIDMRIGGPASLDTRATLVVERTTPAQ